MSDVFSGLHIQNGVGTIEYTTISILNDGERSGIRFES